MIRQLKSKDLKNFIYYCQNRDVFSDFYITKNNKRIFLNNASVAKKVFNDCIKNNEKCFIKEEGNEIKAILLIIGYKDKDERKYLKILSHNKKDFQDLFSYLIWQNLPSNIFIKIHKNNTNFGKFNEKTNEYKPVYAIRKSGFRTIAIRERELLLKKENYTYNRR